MSRNWCARNILQCKPVSHASTSPHITNLLTSEAAAPHPQRQLRVTEQLRLQRRQSVKKLSPCQFTISTPHSRPNSQALKIATGQKSTGAAMQHYLHRRDVKTPTSCLSPTLYFAPQTFRQPLKNNQIPSSHIWELDKLRTESRRINLIQVALYQTNLPVNQFVLVSQSLGTFLLLRSSSLLTSSITCLMFSGTLRVGACPISPDLQKTKKKNWRAVTITSKNSNPYYKEMKI